MTMNPRRVEFAHQELDALTEGLFRTSRSEPVTVAILGRDCIVPAGMSEKDIRNRVVDHAVGQAALAVHAKDGENAGGLILHALNTHDRALAAYNLSRRLLFHLGGAEDIAP